MKERYESAKTLYELGLSENENVKTICDLTGRRVEAITSPGFYIVNGKKTLVK